MSEIKRVFPDTASDFMVREVRKLSHPKTLPFDDAQVRCPVCEQHQTGATMAGHLFVDHDISCYQVLRLYCKSLMSFEGTVEEFEDELRLGLAEAVLRG